MKTKFKEIPKHIDKKEGLCCFNKNLDKLDKVSLLKNNFVLEEKDDYINIYFTKKSNFNIFKDYKNFYYMDGFSPNLNKELHIGHFSNLIIAKALQKLGIVKKTISMLGDTLEGNISNKEGFRLFKNIIKTFNYKVSRIFFASKLKYQGKLEEGKGKYEGTKIFDTNEELIVAIKKDGTTSYTYHDIALAKKLVKDTLYLTGYEQKEHFNKIKKVFKNVHHFPLGLVKISNSKMSTREGNIILIKDILDELNKTFKNNKLSYNVFAGYILKSSPNTDKNINIKNIYNYKNSPGLYLSYTTARLLSAGCKILPFKITNNKLLEYYFILSKNELNPSLLFNKLIDCCKTLNTLYETIKIKGNLKNKINMSIKLTELNYYMKKIGLYLIKKV
jgi:hypothetical protein